MALITSFTSIASVVEHVIDKHIRAPGWQINASYSGPYNSVVAVARRKKHDWTIEVSLELPSAFCSEGDVYRIANELVGELWRAIVTNEAVLSGYV